MSWDNIWDRMMQICTGQDRQEFTTFLDLLSAGPSDINILEIGVDFGATLSAWRAITSGLVIGVDNESYGHRSVEIPNASLVIGNSEDPNIIARVQELLGDKKVDMLFIDADHRYEGVKRDFENYSPLVKEGGIVAFHDVVRKVDNCGVWQLFDELPQKKFTIYNPDSGDDRGIGVWYKK